MVSRGADRLPGVRRVGAPHVRRRAWAPSPTLSSRSTTMLIAIPRASRSSTGSARCTAADPLHDADALRGRASSPCSSSAGSRGHARLAAGRPAATTPTSSWPTSTTCSSAAASWALFAAHLLLVPQDLRPMMNERLGKLHFWTSSASTSRSSPCTGGDVRHAAPRLYLRRRAGLDRLNQLETVGAFVHRLLGPGVRGQPVHQPGSAVRMRRTIRGTGPRSSGPFPRRRRSTTSARSRWCTRACRSGKTTPPSRAGSRTAGWRRRRSRWTLAGTPVGEVRDVQDENKMSAHDLGIHLPPPSFWPIVLAAGVTSIFVGLIFRRVTARCTTCGT